MTPSIRFGTIFQLELPNGPYKRCLMEPIAGHLKKSLERQGVDAIVSLDESVNAGDEKHQNVRIHVRTRTKTGQGDKLMAERNAVFDFLRRLAFACNFSNTSILALSDWKPLKSALDQISLQTVRSETDRLSNETPFLEAVIASEGEPITVNLNFIQNA